VDFVNEGGGRKCRKSMKLLKAEVKVILSVFLAIFLLKVCLKFIASEASEEKTEQKSVLGIKNHRSAAVRGGRAPGAPPPGSASDR